MHARLLKSLAEAMRARSDADPKNATLARHARALEAAGRRKDTAQSAEIVRAINAAEELERRDVAAPDPLGLWLAPGLAAKLRASGINRVVDLLALMASRSTGWHRSVQGVGKARAAALAAWLEPLATEAGMGREALALLTGRTDRSSHRRALAAVEAPAFGIVPLERLALPEHLSGGRSAPGVFRIHGPNMLQASDDLEAARNWLAGFRGREHTLRAYTREVERLLLWTCVELGKPLSSLTTTDCHAYARFLAAVPAHWCAPRSVQRVDALWRPFRGPLGPAAQTLALRVARTFLQSLCSANYLAGNAMDKVGVRALDELGRPVVHERAGSAKRGRALTRADWEFVVRWMREDVDAAQAEVDAERRAGVPARPRRAGAAVDATPATLRLIKRQRDLLALLLLSTTGLRREEAASISLEDLQPVEPAARGVRAAGDGAGAAAPGMHILRVVGKGRRAREVPVAGRVVEEIHRHHRLVREVAVATDRGIAWVKKTASETPAQVASPRTPVLLRLQQMSLDGRRVGWRAVRLSDKGLYDSICGLLERAADHCERTAEPGAAAAGAPDPDRLRRASTHWMRHTMATQWMRSGLPVETLSAILGHASLATTSLYIDVERERMVRDAASLFEAIG